MATRSLGYCWPATKILRDAGSAPVETPKSCLMVPSGMVISFSRLVGATGDRVPGELGGRASSSRGVPVPTPVRSGSGSKGSHVERPVVSQPLSEAPLGSLPVSRQRPGHVKRGLGPESSRRVGRAPATGARSCGLVHDRGKFMSTSSLHASRPHPSPPTLLPPFIPPTPPLPLSHHMLFL